MSKSLRTIDGDRVFKVKSAKSARAIYQEEDRYRNEIETEIILEGGLKITLRFGLADAHQLLQEIGIAYQACQPPPITGLSNYGARVGMWD